MTMTPMSVDYSNPMEGLGIPPSPIPDIAPKCRGPAYNPRIKSTSLLGLGSFDRCIQVSRHEVSRSAPTSVIVMMVMIRVCLRSEPRG